MFPGLGIGISLAVGPSRLSAPYAYNYVVFDGTNDQLDNATNLGLPAPFDTFTAAFAFSPSELDGNALMGFTTTAGLPLVSLISDGSATLNTPTNFATAGIVGKTILPASTLTVGGSYILHIAARASTRTLRVWLNNTEFTQTDTWLGTVAMPVPTAWSVGANISGGTTRFQGSIGLVWFDVGQYITNPSAFYPAKNLGTNLANPGARPAIGFGDTQVAANWNAGTNQGDGTGSWVMTGDV